MFKRVGLSLFFFLRSFPSVPLFFLIQMCKFIFYFILLLSLGDVCFLVRDRNGVKPNGGGTEEEWEE